jgi:predicted nucleic acid-binding protein
MSQPITNNARAAVIDANVLVAILAREPTIQTAKQALANYGAKGWELYAPGAILTEVLFILCKKLQDGLMTAAEHQTAIVSFSQYMKNIHPSPQGDIGFIVRAEEIRQGYSCLSSADTFYIALTEALGVSGAAELLTFDKRLVNIAANNASSVKVNLLPS